MRARPSKRLVTALLAITVAVACSSTRRSIPAASKGTAPSTADPSGSARPATAESASQVPAYEADLGVVVVLDASGSMSGLRAEWAVATTKAVLAAVHDDDAFEVILAREKPEVLVTLRRPIDRGSIHKAINTLSPMGSASLDLAIGLAVHDLEGFALRRRHVVVVTDANSGPGPSIYTATLEARDDAVTVTTVVVGNSQPSLSGVTKSPWMSVISIDANNAADLKARMAEDLSRVRGKP